MRWPARRLSRWILVLSLGIYTGTTGAAPLPEPVLDGFYDRWLSGVSAWMLEAEREAFAKLTGDDAREIFIRRFWQARTATEPAGDNLQLARWHLNFEEARHRFETLDDERAQALLIAGKPARIVVFPGCRTFVRPLRIWSYEGGRDRPGAHLVFWLDGGAGGTYRLWSPNDGVTPLIFDGPASHRRWSIEEVIDYTREKKCFRWSPGEARRVATALRGATGSDDLQRLVSPPPPDPVWLDELQAELAGTSGATPLDAPSDTALPATVAFLFPGGYQQKTVLQGRIFVPARVVRRNAEGLLFDRIVITGDVKLGDRLVDAFRVVHLVAGAAPEARPTADEADSLSVQPDHIVLDFYRRLRPGTYSLSLRVEDALGLGLLRQSHRLEVPEAAQDAPAPAGSRLGLPGLTRPEVGVLTTFPGVEILPPAEELLIGDVEIAAVTTGGPIERMEFQLDGQTVATDDIPPWAATMDLGSEPKSRRIAAVAFDPAGHEIARGATTLNTGPQRFVVRLVAPLPGSGGRQAEVDVDVPSGRRLDRLELFVNQRRIATLAEPPFIHPLPAAEPGIATYVRALATLDNGEAMEDLVFVYSPNPFDHVEVQLVELYTSVRDRQGRFVTGLAREDFRVLEDGAPQPIRRFDTVRNLAINVALLMDVSSSMRKKIGIATRSAQRFFEAVLTPRDRASLLTFNHDIRQVVPFTNNVNDLRHGVSGFRAWGTTRLLDGLVYATHSFGGLEGKRALVLLSDGQDVDSDFTFKQVLEIVLRSSVAVYPIALGVEDTQTASDLTRLAEASGGRFFQIVSVSQLDQIYRQIEEELRSQYLLVYDPPATGLRELRRVEVEVLRDGLKARSIHGYYP